VIFLETFMSWPSEKNRL